MRYISRSGYETYTACERKYYYSQLWGRGGVEPPVQDENLSMGIALHAGQEHLMRAVKGAWDKSVLGPANLQGLLATHIPFCLEAISLSWLSEMAPTYAIAKGDPEADPPHPRDDALLGLLDEWHHLARGMFLAWVRVHARRFFDMFEVLMVEEQVPLELAAGLTLDTRSDVVVRHRQTGYVFVINWKTFGSKSGFYEAFNRSIQMWTEALAVQQKLGEPVAGTIVEGFYKGSKKRGSYSSPLLWAYEQNAVWSAKYRPGWRKVPVWQTGYELPNGLWGQGEWIDWLPLTIVEDQFLRTTPIPINEGAVSDWLPQVVQRETDLQHMMEEATEADRLRYFFQRFGKQCNWCPFDDVCRQAATIESMVESGRLVKRRDHHRREEEGV